MQKDKVKVNLGMIDLRFKFGVAEITKLKIGFCYHKTLKLIAMLNKGFG